MKQGDDFSLSDFHRDNNFDVDRLRDDPVESARDLVNWLGQVDNQRGVIVVFETVDACMLLDYFEEFLPGFDLSEFIEGYAPPSSIFHNRVLWDKAGVGLMPISVYLGGTGFGLQSVCNALNGVSFDENLAHGCEYDAFKTREALVRLSDTSDFRDSHCYSVVAHLSTELESCLGGSINIAISSPLSLLPLLYLAGEMDVCERMYAESPACALRQRMEAEHRSAREAESESDVVQAMSSTGPSRLLPVNVARQQDKRRCEEAMAEIDRLKTQLALTTSQLDVCRARWQESRERNMITDKLYWEEATKSRRKDDEIDSLQQQLDLLSVGDEGGHPNKRRNISPCPPC